MSHSVIESSSDCKILKNVVSVVLSGLFSKLEIVACLMPIFFASSLCVQPFLLANQFHCIRQLRWAIDLLKAHHVIRPQQIYPLKGILSVLSFSEIKSIWKHILIRCTG
ncbi:Uncharacterised protein [Escherichia coli]|uniref:Uncharacterized protein n=1 Tax=Escherichia coli TaxID=562 RepID=A0A376UAY4_ECOLX|nr:Uncharacterised protein [Escherichia coli]